MIADEFGAVPTQNRAEHFRGAISAVRSDEVLFGDTVHVRDYVVHFGAVAVVALDSEDRVLIIQQYRHPLASRLWEIPAGLLDKANEDPLAAAKRELAEEAGVVASDWCVLVDYATTPGGSTEVLRIYLARDLATLPERPKTQEAEEQDMPLQYVTIDELCESVLSGALCNTSVVVGALAVRAAKASHWRTLRAAHAPWPLREHLLMTDRVFRV
jgi:8-oxo-dGTP pyrophosphatase MutT (NUDIX family)